MKLGKRYWPKRASLETYRVYDERQRIPLSRLQSVAAELSPETGGRGLVIYGTIGTGKDHLLAAMLYRAIRAGLTCSWSNGLEIFASLRDVMDTDRGEASVMKQFTGPQVLGISDPVPPAEGKLTTWRAEVLVRIIDARYRELRPTWITMNGDSVADLKRKLTSPVFDRLQQDAEFVPCFWSSFRGRAS